jgi:hypothetical protein
MTGHDRAPDPAARQELWTSGNSGRSPAGKEISLVDLLDRLLAGGVVVTGDVALSIAGVDLVHISLRALITSVKDNRPSPLQS